MESKKISAKKVRKWISGPFSHFFRTFSLLNASDYAIDELAIGFVAHHHRAKVSATVGYGTLGSAKQSDHLRGGDTASDEKRHMIVIGLQRYAYKKLQMMSELRGCRQHCSLQLIP